MLLYIPLLRSVISFKHNKYYYHGKIVDMVEIELSTTQQCGVTTSIIISLVV